MPLTLLATRGYGSPSPVQGSPLRPILLALTMLLACAKGATLPEAPSTVLHYPAWIATFHDQELNSDKLLVANLDQDLAYDNGALVAIDPTSGEVLGGVPLPNMAGQFVVVEGAASAGVGLAPADFDTCQGKLDPSTFPRLPEQAPGPAQPFPFALVAGRFEDTLFHLTLTPGETQPIGPAQPNDLLPFLATQPFGAEFTCSPVDGKPRGWVSYMSGQNDVGYIAQVDLSLQPGAPGRIVQVNVGQGAPRTFAYDAKYDRLYFTGMEFNQAAPLRWIQVGNGCQPAVNGIQDERTGGCHVDSGFDLSLQLRGAEPNVIRLSEDEPACTTAGFTGRNCRRAYLSVRMYDADLAAFLGSRPSSDVGGKLVVLELPEGGLGRPEPQVVASLDIGMMAGDVHLIPRAGKRPLVAVTAVEDDLLWIYDDEIGAMVKVFGKAATGVPVLGHRLSAITSIANPAGDKVRVFVTSYQDNWVSAVDVPLADPGGATVVPDPSDSSKPWRLGVTP
jgi:hypothetical protein